MGYMRTAGLAILLISFGTFVALFGRLPALRNTPIGTLYRLIWFQIPRFLRSLDQRITNGRLSNYVTQVSHRLFYEKHPIIVIFFVLILAVSEYMYIPSAFPRMSFSLKLFSTILVIAPYTFLYLAAYTDPGYIGPENHAHNMTLYPYDHTIFHPGKSCDSCHHLKPARSKHCSVCKRCIAKTDHHCVFINNCVGYGNHHWFMLLLLSTGVLTVYAALLGGTLMGDEIRKTVPQWTFWGSGLTWIEFWSHWGYVLQDDVGVGAISLLCILISPLVWVLFLYNTYLIYTGTTTNETLKWRDWQYEMNEGYVWKRQLYRDLQPGQMLNLSGPDPPSDHWPVTSKQVVVRTHAGYPPYTATQTQEGDWVLGPVPQGFVEPDCPWERVYNLSEVENLYDMGFKTNLIDIVKPRHGWYGFSNNSSSCRQCPTGVKPICGR